MQSAMKVSSEHTPGRRGRKPGRKRRQELLQSAFKLAAAASAPAKTILPLKIPKKRGPKPGSKRKSRLAAPSPPPVSPTFSTPEPDTSSVPQDAANVPTSAISQALTVCIYVKKHACPGPHLDKKKLQQLPDHFGPARASMVLQQAVQACIDCAYQQRAVFSCLKPGHGGELISASFDGDQHTLNLPAVHSIGFILRFLENLCHSLHCDNLFSSQPFSIYNATSQISLDYESDRMHPGTEGGASVGIVSSPPHHRVVECTRNLSTDAIEAEIPEDVLLGPVESRYGVDSAECPLHSMERRSPSGRNAGDHRSTGPLAYAYRSGYQPSSTPPSAAPRRLSPTTPTPTSFYDGKDTLNTACSPVLVSERHTLAQDSVRLSTRHPSTWSVDDVMRFVRESDPHALAPHADLFRKHEIDGNALILLKSDVIMKYMGLKLGPALKLCYHIDKLQQSKH
ncbi:polycomb protein SCMH1 [Leucoraja erinacea]|uniref:polycomb protein SCMH1 n=1 Tax=Leucoraja erinaceus TaxID=7782 RepID=UPI002458FD86|nr:polycomb protein SCMH1 [Leucoraja erinacea]